MTPGADGGYFEDYPPGAVFEGAQSLDKPIDK